MELNDFYHWPRIENWSNMRKCLEIEFFSLLNLFFRIEDKLKIHSQYRIEADAIPTCLIHYPSGRFEEEFLFTANDKFKLRFVAIS